MSYIKKKYKWDFDLLNRRPFEKGIVHQTEGSHAWLYMYYIQQFNNTLCFKYKLSFSFSELEDSSEKPWGLFSLLALPIAIILFILCIYKKELLCFKKVSYMIFCSNMQIDVCLIKVKKQFDMNKIQMVKVLNHWCFVKEVKSLPYDMFWILGSFIELRSKWS